MTMTAAIVQQNTGFLYADTACFDPGTGELVGFDGKIGQGTRFPWALAATYCGWGPATRELAALDAASNVPELVGGLAPAIRRFKNESLARGHPSPAMRLLVVAWDVRTGSPRIFAIGDGLENFTPSWWLPPGVIEMDSFIGVDSDISHIWGGGSPNDPECFDPIADAIAIFDHRRANPFTPLGEGRPWAHVGGELHCVTVTAEGTSAIVLHEWAEKAPAVPRAGSRIEPAPLSVADA